MTAPLKEPLNGFERRERQELRARLVEAEEALRAIGEGEVDAVIVNGSRGKRIYSLQETENLYRQMVETMNEAGFAVSKDGTLLFCNERACELLQSPMIGLLGRPLSEFVVDHERDLFDRLIQDALTRPSNEQFHFLSESGAPLLMHLGASRLDRPEGPMICLMGTDLSRLESQKKMIEILHKRNEELRESRAAALNIMEDAVEARARVEEANKDLEAFSYSVSHDLRNPLNAILTNAELLALDASMKPDSDAHAALAHITRCSERMAQVIKDLLTLSGISRKNPRLEKVDLSGMAGAFLSELKASDADRNAEINIQPGLTVETDSGLLRLLLENLLRNAWKFTSQKPVSRVEVGGSERDGKRFYYVRDNGVGFDIKHSDKLFKPYQRLHSNEEFKGTGIGLAIAKRIVEKLGGTIWAESEREKGAAFYFHLGTS